MVMFAFWDGPVWLERCASNVVLHIDYSFCLMNRLAQYIKLSESVALLHWSSHDLLDASSTSDLT